MKNISLQRSRSETLSLNILKGKLAEEIAKEDYVEHGYKIINTGIGSDFRAVKVVHGHKIYEEYVDVKAGKARLSKRQLSTRRMLIQLRKKYFVYRVSDEYLKHQLKEMDLDDFQGKVIVKDFARCPHCNVEVHGIMPVLRVFGIRRMKNNIVRVQAWCKKCRSK